MEGLLPFLIAGPIAVAFAAFALWSWRKSARMSELNTGAQETAIAFRAPDARPADKNEDAENTGAGEQETLDHQTNGTSDIPVIADWEDSQMSSPLQPVSVKDDPPEEHAQQATDSIDILSELPSPAAQETNNGSRLDGPVGGGDGVAASTPLAGDGESSPQTPVGDPVLKINNAITLPAGAGSGDQNNSSPLEPSESNCQMGGGIPEAGSAIGSLLRNSPEDYSRGVDEPEPAVSPATTGTSTDAEPVFTDAGATGVIAGASDADGVVAGRSADESPPAGQVLRSPRQYRPAQRDARRPRRGANAAGDGRDSDLALPLYLRVVFERAGFCRVSLLARRNAALPADVVVAGTGGPGALAALDEDWYQDAALESGEILRSGVEWSSSESAVRWSLGGREIFVLAARDDLSGFVSTARLVIGDSHLVLCTDERLPDVQAAIAATGSPAPSPLESDSGIPPGWVGLLHVVPKCPVAPLANGDILDVLRPLAEAEIALNGGIRLARGCWLAGHPPQIRLRGDVAAAGTVQIDGQEALPDAAGRYRVPGWDACGEHWVACASGSRTYQIENGKDQWDSWAAYTWSSDGGSEGDRRRPSICGGLVLPPQARPSTREILQLPTSNPVLVGPRPGDVYVCEQRTDIRVHELVAFPPFDPVWALPANALHCNKKVVRIMRLASLAPEINGHLTPRNALRTWCLAILDAGRKGLAVDTGDASADALWNAYKRVARAIWRKIR